MAKVVLDADIESISGKLSKKKSAMYCTNKKTGKCYRAEYNSNRVDKNSEDQQEVRTTFKQRAKAASNWWATNKPTEDNPTPNAEWKAMQKAYDAQSKYGNPYAFVRSRVNKDTCTVAFTDGTTDNDPDDTPQNTPQNQPQGTTYTITGRAEYDEFGSVAPSTSTVSSGAEVTLTATPEQGYEFSEWSDHNTDNPRTVTATEDKEYVACFSAASTGL